MFLWGIRIWPAYHIGLFLFKRTISLFFRPFFDPPPGSGLGAPGRPGIDSARSLDLLGIVGDDAGQVPTVLGPYTTPTRRSCPRGACHRALSGPAAALGEIRKFARKCDFFKKHGFAQTVPGRLWQAPGGQHRRVGVVHGPRTIGTCPASSPTMPSRSRDRAGSIPGLPGAPRPNPGGE